MKYNIEGEYGDPMFTQDTLSYYDANADAFVNGTKNANMTESYRRFLAHLPKNGRILDFGCGSGRDTKYFLEQGYQADAVDGSEELCRIASEFTGIRVRQMLFTELEGEEVYDGIWACASILHLPKDDLTVVLQKIDRALKKGGILYTGFKYGTFEGIRGGRYFTDFTEETLNEYWKQEVPLRLLETWISQDVRPGRGEERWINLIAVRD